MMMRNCYVEFFNGKIFKEMMELADRFADVINHRFIYGKMMHRGVFGDPVTTPISFINGDTFFIVN